MLFSLCIFGMSMVVDKDYIFKGGPKGPFFIGLLQQMKSDPIGFMEKNSIEYGDFIPFSVMGKNMIQVNHPDLVRYVLMSNAKNYSKGKNYRRFEPALGQGLFTSSGEKWKKDRQKIQPMFKTEQIQGYYFDIVKSVSIKYKKLWEDRIKSNDNIINISSEMSFMTTEIILKSIFGKDNINDESVRSLHRSYSVLIEYLKKQRLFPDIDFRAIFNTGQYKLFKEELANIENILNELIIRYNNGSVCDEYNMLSLLLKDKKLDSESWSNSDIRDHTVSMVVGGFETTSLLMQWIWFALDTNPNVRENLYNQLVINMPYLSDGNSDKISYKDMVGIEYLNGVISEAMRLYPPFWATARTPIKDDYFGSYKVKAGSVVILPQMIMHRHERWWHKSKDFLPERFADNQNKEKEFIYFPFSLGPRKCIGFRFAIMEAKTIISVLATSFNVEILNSESHEFSPGITLKTKNNIMAKISKITAKATIDKESCEMAIEA